MKGFVLFLFIFVGSVVGFMNYYQEIGQWYMAKIIVDEGGPYPNATFDKFKAENPDGFKLKFDSDLGSRLTVAHFADLTNKEEYFLKVAEETKTMYFDSPLVQRDGFGDLIFNLASHYEEQNHFQDAYSLFKAFIETYPNNSNIPDAKRESDHLKFKYALN